MPVAASVPTPTADDGEAPRRSGRLVLVLGGLAAVSAVFAAVVIFSNSTAEPAKPKDPVAQVRAGDRFLAVGAGTAATKVVVYEDFGSPDSRTFDISSRDFLRDEAARGNVEVEYRPVALADVDYSADAVAAWGAVLEQGRPGQALALHDLLFDLQPRPDDTAEQEFGALARKAGVRDTGVLDAAGSPDPAWAAATRQEARAAGVRTTPSVRVDGERLTASSPVALADRLQRLVLERTASS
jgi:protein-disulfide isomerase